MSLSLSSGSIVAPIDNFLFPWHCVNGIIASHEEWTSSEILASESRMIQGTATIITENNIHNWVGESQFNRGMRYVQEGLIHPHYQSGRMIRGWCFPRDNQPGVYYVWARTAGIRICDAHCTCALGKYGICPHVAAVLVHFVRDPQNYQRTFWQRLFSPRLPVAAATPAMPQTQQAA